MKTAFAAILVAALLPLVAAGASPWQTPPLPGNPDRQASAVKPDALTFWRPRVVHDDSLFGALGELGRTVQDHMELRSRGYVRPFHFRYKNFTYERDYFNLYKGLLLRQFLDGKLDVGLYRHRLYRGLMFGPQGSYLPSGSNRIELMIRWNLGDR